MKDLSQKVAYLQGLAEGLGLDSESKEGRVITGILDALEDVSEYLTDLADQQDDMEDYLECVDSDLADVEEEVFGDEDDEDEDYVDVECPNCHEVVSFDASYLDEEDSVEVICPNCSAVVFSNDEAYVGCDDGCICCEEDCEEQPE